MTEEILQAAIMKLRARSTERFGLIKDLYHRPATTETTELIVQHAIALAQLEGAMITLQQYSGALSQQTEAESDSNKPEEPPTEVEVEEDEEESNHDKLMKQSATYRESTKKADILKKAKEKRNES